MAPPSSLSRDWRCDRRDTLLVIRGLIPLFLVYLRMEKYTPTSHSPMGYGGCLHKKQVVEHLRPCWSPGQVERFAREMTVTQTEGGVYVNFTSSFWGEEGKEALRFLADLKARKNGRVLQKGLFLKR